ncbi:NADH-quinone oxidoreductase subunit C [Arhodomonas aquaeolei]|uniref:NADH-quinone oxidoreductase subunit C n=1 Tax=Arhodomonas aquaeolei TaxID=2369 RepID=UPI002169FB2D|nr:NADH-quinone oxidoreductase subunit C [Arhodomonas aquaeolei]MCS4504676.1 NADH-quinone oxidoreductase subunit C [Arhodomonas aquaeolei]
MALSAEELAGRLEQALGQKIAKLVIDRDEVDIEVRPEDLYATMLELRDHGSLRFEQLIDIAGVDYAAYGDDEWITEEATSVGFSRGVDGFTTGRLGLTGIYGVQEIHSSTGRRFAAVYQLLSLSHNHRVRVRCYAADDNFPVVDSVVPIWSCANWFEREAFDLYGIVFDGHPDLRRILTDYGFVGHPFRKDFPLIGNVEVRFDEERGRVVYEPVSIEPRVTVPRVVREDNRYAQPAPQQEGGADA